MNLVKQVSQLTHGYVSKGGQRSRKDRRKIMIKFAKFSQSMGANSMGEVGKRHVIKYWKAHTHLKESTLSNHWYAIHDLWDLVGLVGEPPKFKIPSVPIQTLENQPLGTDELINEIVGYSD